MKRGFTLIELIVVIVIVGILATLGFVQYAKTLERARGMEARKILGQLRQAQIMYYFENDAYTSDMTVLLINAPTACTSTYFFSYTAVGTTPDDGVGSALRCISDGKNPNVVTSYTVNVTWSGGVWGGTTGYY